jgi:hypothetical protein
MVVWGGESAGVATATGARYDPTGDSWSPTAVGTDCPAARSRHTAVWSGSEMIVWGGSYRDPAEHLLGTGGRYEPASDAWSPVASSEASPSARDGHTAVWSGSEMIVWGGRDAAASLATGARYCAAACSSPAPSGSPALVVSKGAAWTDLSWTVLFGASAYDVVRGALGILRATGGDFTLATTTCLANDTPGTSAPDPATPPLSDGFWYVVRGASCGGPGTYDDASPSESGSRDAEIGGSAQACP